MTNENLKSVKVEFSLEDITSYIDLTEAEIKTLQKIKKVVLENFDIILDIFYKKILDNPVPLQILDSANSSVDLLKQKLSMWMKDIFASGINETFFENQKLIGMVHVKVNLPQPFMVVGMSIIKDCVDEILKNHLEGSKSDIENSRMVMGKVLDLSLAVMLKSYQEAREISLEEKINLKNENLVAMGRMSAQIAHEVKNPLAGISGAVRVIKDTFTPDQEYYGVADGILKRIDSLHKTVVDLLQFAKPIIIKRQKVKMSMIIEDLECLIKKESDNYDVHFSVDEKTKCLELNVEVFQIQQVFLNLALNAIYAMDGKGEIRIYSEKTASITTIFFQDNGPGIEQEFSEELFKPFSTSKVRGNGLGLSICKKIIEAHDGIINLEPSINNGALFKITLPNK